MLPVSPEVVLHYPSPSVKHYVIIAEARYRYPAREARVVDAVRSSEVIDVSIYLGSEGGPVGLPDPAGVYLVIVPAKTFKHVAKVLEDPRRDPSLPPDLWEYVLNRCRKIRFDEMEIVDEKRWCVDRYCSFQNVERLYAKKLASDVLLLLHVTSGATQPRRVRPEVVDVSRADEASEVPRSYD